MGRDEFMQLSPRFFAVLTRQHGEARDRSERTMEFMLAQVVSMVANTGFQSFKSPRNPVEFMPSEWKREEAAKPVAVPIRKLTRKQRIKAGQAKAEALKKALNGLWGD